MCVYIQRGIYFKELLHIIVEASKPKICRVGQEVRESINSRCCSSSMKTTYWWNFHLIQGCQSVYIKAFKSLEGPTPIIEGPLLYKTIDSNVNPIWEKKRKKQNPQNLQRNF